MPEKCNSLLFNSFLKTNPSYRFLVSFVIAYFCRQLLKINNFFHTFNDCLSTLMFYLTWFSSFSAYFEAQFISANSRWLIVRYLFYALSYSIPRSNIESREKTNVTGIKFDRIVSFVVTLVRDIISSRRGEILTFAPHHEHAYIIMTPLNPTFIL